MRLKRAKEQLAADGQQLQSPERPPTPHEPQKGIHEEHEHEQRKHRARRQALRKVWLMDTAM